MSAITKTLVGFFVIFIFLSIFAGLSTAVMLIGLSIICTFGISLVLWIPLSFAVGSITVSVYNAVNQSKKTDLGQSTRSTISNDQKAITDYIKQSKSKGISDDNIFSLLRSNGWAENAIHEAFGHVATHQAS